MSELEYIEAQKLGRKKQKNCIAQGLFPYLPVLDEILTEQDILSEQPLGLVNIPLDHVVGTSTKGRTYAFAANFMPILDTKTEFAYKWSTLADAQINEGIRDPIICYEFMNRFYVVEGNKRVSVLKYFKADSIAAVVTRKIPKLTEDYDIKLYYEFMEFNEISGVNTLEFSRLGKADQLLELMDKKEKWDDKTKEEFNSVLYRFTKAYESKGGAKLPITVGDAFVAFMNVFGYESMLEMSVDDYMKNVAKCWSEFVILTEKDRVDLVMHPEDVQTKKHFFSYFMPNSSKKFTVAFLYPKTPEKSDWIYTHELGRSYLEESFPEQIETICLYDVNEENVEEKLNAVIEAGAKIIFELAPQVMKHSLKVAVEHPEVTILNCCLDAPHKSISTYYARMYEAKFLSGMVAGAMSENDKIAYVADYPMYGMIANINAFALGALCVNPRAKVYLEWSTRKGYDLDKFLQENDIHYVSNQDMITPQNASRQFGLYRFEQGEATNLVMPVWNWGVFYEKMIQRILSGVYRSKENEESKALNYWWGMSAGVIDLICSKHVPNSVQRLINHMKYDVASGFTVPFHGEIYAQDGTLMNQADVAMQPEDIMRMNYLVENVIGDIPETDEVVEDAKSIMELKDVEESK